MGCGASAEGGGGGAAGGNKVQECEDMKIEVEDTGLDACDVMFKKSLPLLDEVKSVNKGLIGSTDEVRKSSDPTNPPEDIGTAACDIMSTTAEANKGDDGKIDPKYFDMPVDTNDLMKGKLTMTLPDFPNKPACWNSIVGLKDSLKKIVEESLVGLKTKVEDLVAEFKTLSVSEVTKQAKEKWGSEGFAAMPKISAAASTAKKNLMGATVVSSALKIIVDNIKKILMLLQKGFTMAKDKLKPMLADVKK